MNEVVGAYAPRLGHCTLNDVLQFSRNHHHRDRMRRLLPAIAAWKRKQLPTITIKGLLDFGGTVDDGKLVRSVALPWFEIMKMIEQDPDSIYQIDPFKWEEIIAGAYAQAGFDEVVLTPRSGDNGRDIVATKNGIGSIRIFDQMKAYAPNRVVPANDVRALIGTITGAGNVSKGIVTTTSDFAPHLLDDPYIKSLVPHRLELKPRDALLNWLGELSTPAGTE